MPLPDEVFQRFGGAKALNQDAAPTRGERTRRRAGSAEDIKSRMSAGKSLQQVADDLGLPVENLRHTLAIAAEEEIDPGCTAVPGTTTNAKE